MKNKIVYLEYLRVIATIAVIITHIFTTARIDFPIHTNIENFVSIFTVQILHFCVPIFLMITGTLFLKKEKEISIKQLYTKYIKKYILVLLVFGYTFCLIEYYIKNGFNSGIFLTSLLNLLKGETWSHMWYLYMLIGLFMILPFIKILYNYLITKKDLLKYFIIISVIACFIYPMCFEMFGYTIPVEIPLFSNYTLYLILGAAIDQKMINIKSKTAYMFFSIVILILLLTNILNMNYNIETLEIIGQYNSVIILMLSISIFSIFKNNEFKFKNNKLITFLSNYSFPAYLLHMIVINIVYKFIGFSIYGKHFICKSIILSIISIIITYIIAFICKKTPIIKKIL